MKNHLLVLNSGSSSLKFSVFDAEHALNLIYRGSITGLDHTPTFVVKNETTKLHQEILPKQPTLAKAQPAALEHLLAWLKQSNVEITIVGHRVVHGGVQFVKPVLINSTILNDLKTLIPLAPLHQPHNLAGIETLLKLNPNLPQVACFDTQFHAEQSPVRNSFALPRALRDIPIKRYGFHGLSYEYIVQEIQKQPLIKKDGKIIVAHLGHGSSLCAIEHGKSVATTMGFTALDGLPMGTRCGQLDPGVILYLLQTLNYTPEQISTLLYEKSGLLGLSEQSADMQTLLSSTTTEAQFALDVLVERITREIGGLVAVLGGIDHLIFTAGIGENAAEIRQRVLLRLQYLGFQLDQNANENHRPCITAATPVSAWVIPTNEELMIARHTLKLHTV